MRERVGMDSKGLLDIPYLTSPVVPVQTPDAPGTVASLAGLNRLGAASFYYTSKGGSSG